jgi:hypothetical protein
MQTWGGVRTMRCLSCGGEMRLIGVADDRELLVPGYLHHTFECAACNETETRLLFTRERPVPVAPAPVREAEMPSESAWEQAIAKLRNHQLVLSAKAEIRKASERAAEFNRQWDLLPQRKAKPALRSRPDASSLWARAIARLRPVPGSER